MRTRSRLGLAVLSLLATACSSHALPPAASIKSTQSRMFIGGPRIVVSKGSTGQESTDAGPSVWWFNARSGTISVKNRSSRAQTILVTASVITPCPTPATVTFVSRNQVMLVPASATGAPLNISLKTSAHGSRKISFSIKGIPCHPPGDARLLYAGVYGLGAQVS